MILIGDKLTIFIKTYYNHRYYSLKFMNVFNFIIRLILLDYMIL